MKTSRRIAAIAAREIKQLVAMAAERVGREEDSIRKQRPSFRPLALTLGARKRGCFHRTDIERSPIRHRLILSGWIAHPPVRRSRRSR